MPDLPNFPGVPTPAPQQAPQRSAPVGAPTPAPLFQMPVQQSQPVQQSAPVQQPEPAPVQSAPVQQSTPQQQQFPPLGVAPAQQAQPAQQQPASRPEPKAVDKTAARDGRLISVTIPKFAREEAKRLAVKLDDEPRHVYAAAVLLFGQLEPAAQVQWVNHARAAFAAAPIV